jgi:colicin import membrane protein
MNYNANRMAGSLKQSKTEAQGAARRRSTRLAITIPITVSGKDSAGHTFKENSRTVVISKHGAKILSVHQLGMGAEVVIENRALGRTARATVVCLVDRPSPKDPMEVGIQLLHAENIWGIEFPPDDWQEGPPAATVSPKPEPARPPAPVAPVAQKAPETRRPSVPPIVPAPPTVSPGFLDSTAQASVARFTQEIEDTFNARFRQFEQRLTSLTQQTSHQAQAELQDLANRQEEKLAHLLEQELGSLEQRLQASRADLETLQGRLEALRQTTQTEVEKAERNIQTASFAALQAAAEELDEKVRKKLEAASADFVEETRERVADAGSAAVETFGKEASARLTKLTEDYLATLAPELEARRSQLSAEVGGHVSQVVQTAVAEFDEKLRKTAAEMAGAFRGELEKSLADTTGHLTTQAVQSLRDQSQTASQEAESSFRQNVQEIQKQIQAAVSNAEARVRQVCEQEADKAYNVVGEEIARRAGLAVDSVRLSTEQAIAQSQATSQEIGLGFKAVAEDHRAEIGRLSSSALEELQRRSDTLLKGFQGRLEKAVLEAQQKGAKEILDKLQRATDESLDVAAQDLQKQAADALLLLTDELKTSGRGLVEEARKELTAITGQASETLGRQAEAAKLSVAGLEAAGKTAVEETDKQLGALTREALESIGKQAEAAELSTAELEIAGKAAVEEARKQLAAVTREVLDTVSKDTRAAQLSTAALEAAGKAAVEQTREQLAILRRESLEVMTEEARTLAKECPLHVRKTLQDFQDQRTRELEDHLQAALEKQRQAVLKQVQKVGEEASEQAVVQVQSKCEQVVKEISGDLERQRGATASALKDWEEQTRARLEKQVADLSAVMAEKMRQESEALTRDFQGRLQQTARAFQDENLREIEEKLKESTLKQIEESDAEFDKRAAENLELVFEQLKEKQEQAVEEATDLFRTTVGQMFASLQISPKKPAETEPAKKRR